MAKRTVKIMKARDNLEKIHPKCYIRNLGYRKGYAVYDSRDVNKKHLVMATRLKMPMQMLYITALNNFYCVQR